ncbi:hypothetical protein [Anaeromicropila herbilytica]|uniref:Uncharacterized protein n=1 Tax=Anaeromicropila herbilytica TaxID=2785025 RepID=A0A7R7EI02_9FIRM|nr:hypothetical protein [Anaeromicropila herbilytica]BCN29127.1 hypothetical protein bsdtb5_04220 [Anaeromicropila herbilytica]
MVRKPVNPNFLKTNTSDSILNIFKSIQSASISQKDNKGTTNNNTMNQSPDSSNVETTYPDSMDSIRSTSNENKQDIPKVLDIELNQNTLKDAIILSEILNQPLCRRRKRRTYGN